MTTRRRRARRRLTCVNAGVAADADDRATRRSIESLTVTEAVPAAPPSTVPVRYQDDVVLGFSIMTVVWGIVGMAVGVLIAAELIWPDLNMGLSVLSYGRLRPLHTNAVVFAFGGSALFATSYWVVQRTCHAPLFAPGLARFTFWGWQAVIVAAAITLPMGLTQSKEYAELEWPIDLLIAVVWVAYAVVFFGTIARRQVSHIYVANWFYGSFILAVAVLHIVNSAAMPIDAFHSYSAYAGAVDAMVQWWYGHNAVGFFLTAGFLGMMYYFVPKQAGRPIYSYRLSIVHFWALISVYMWAGPHHLHYTALPDWVQSLGMVFSLILLAPSWGGMINGVMTLSGAWHKLREDPILKFLIVSLSFYGMSTFEGPMMSIKPLHRLDHRARAQRRARLGGDDLAGLDLHADPAPGRQAADAQHRRHQPALLARDHRDRDVHRGDVDRGRDAGPDVARHGGRRDPDLQLHRVAQGDLPLLRTALRRRRRLSLGHVRDGLERVAHGAPRACRRSSAAAGPERVVKHEFLEKNVGWMAVAIAVAISIGGLVEIIPLMNQKAATQPAPGLQLRTPLEVAGRDVYLREGCYNCHSQQVRSLAEEVLRYGPAATAGESVYDHPFQWGSKRTGPDLSRVGGRFSDQWHRMHLRNPRDLVTESNMPAYGWLEEEFYQPGEVAEMMRALSRLGVPYSDADIAMADGATLHKSKLDALVAYLQSLRVPVAPSPKDKVAVQAPQPEKSS
jgi:cbb3-type cytochrome c oxidase subunit I/cbb3-type cytochrome c oxidase subunit II